ncbi:LiaI-LiaF-like domain-containing protein [Halobacillus amylolyticus]|uniref:DUF5668 domain-containing protein n=1 Tax=Halobacillus amylolyticus TaxID=2932259 RepID=A0ABY4HCI7_9BACI|nr:DUF5668 domain-containing protein [Halobacillus amylolyticus]UOR12147.1 DUF5668 domain-containing protein [Halobacillus amylolyticus]
MKKPDSFAGFLLIGLGLYFLVRQFNIPYLNPFYSWTTLLIIIGIAFLLHSYLTKEYSNIFTGALLLGLGIHFHGRTHYPFWIDHWGVYPLLIGAAFILRSIKTRSGWIPGFILIGVALFALLSTPSPGWFHFIYLLFDWVESFWPVILIGFGIYLLYKKK